MTGNWLCSDYIELTLSYFLSSRNGVIHRVQNSRTNSQTIRFRYGIILPKDTPSIRPSRAKISRHTNIITTRKYAKITTKKIDKDLTKLEHRLNRLSGKIFSNVIFYFEMIALSTETADFAPRKLSQVTLIRKA